MKGLIINEINQPENALLSTAIDDYSLKNVQEDTMIFHLFQHEGINMGRDDTRIENFDQGIAYYQSQNVPVTLRQSGGRSIVSDQGVISVSLTYVAKHNDVYRHFSEFGQFISSAFTHLGVTIDTGLIDGAYCPGDSDLSIAGKKFSGTAMKKFKNNVEMDAYIAINGAQLPRTRLVQGFYEAMNFREFAVLDDKMDTLSALSKQEISVEQASLWLIESFAELCDETVYLSVADLDQELLEKSRLFTEKRHTIL